ncbi:MAG: nodulation protein NfeD, partial [Candidatus Omnitrophica bacterium]|nr:nodulation protein NfeD [Candidatus Omnitrophota bacterium]
MSQIRRLTVIMFCLELSAFSLPATAQAAHVNVIELDNQIISPVTQQYILESIERSEREPAECLVLVLDTPGGLLESTRAIVKRMMNAGVPIVVYVAPSGARAGSAGVFLTLASHIAAMAPSTNIGAAHPVTVGEGGGPVKKLIRRMKRAVNGESGKPEKPHEEEIVEEEQKDPMAEKIMNDTVAWVTTIARSRHRNEAWAKKAVTDSVSVTEDEAVQDGIVDLIAKDLPELLKKLDGWPVETAKGPQTLATDGAQVTHIAMTPRQRFLAVITNPNIAYLLMLLGTLGLVFEFTHPGIGFPGIAGLICVILAMY